MGAPTADVGAAGEGEPVGWLKFGAALCGAVPSGVCIPAFGSMLVAGSAPRCTSDIEPPLLEAVGGIFGRVGSALPLGGDKLCAADDVDGGIPIAAAPPAPGFEPMGKLGIPSGCPDCGEFESAFAVAGGGLVPEFNQAGGAPFVAAPPA